MIRRILWQTSAPTVLLGLTLLGVCLAGAWSVGRLQTNLARILSDDVASLEAAQELEIQLRHLRVHSMLCVLDPSPRRRALLEQDHLAFEAAISHARDSARQPEEQRLVEEIQVGYQLYRAELDHSDVFRKKAWDRDDFLAWADSHSTRPLARPCQQLLRMNKDAMAETAAESEALAQRTRWVMVVLGLAGTVGGLIVGLGLARGLIRSVARLEVRVQDVQAQLGREVASVELSGGLGGLERQLDRVVAQVRAVVAQVQQQQQEVLRAEQLAAVGQLAASVAHEVRNPLTAIKMLVGAALRGASGGGLSSEDLRVIHGEVVRLERTVQNLLDFARMPEPRREPADLTEVVGSALAVVRVRAEQQGVATQASSPETPVVASVDRGQLQAALVNLFLNALDAMPGGGRLEVALDETPEGVRLAVRDTGPGIAPDVLPRLFTPFASGKPTGTGLGLTVCRRVIQQHGGDVRGGNRPGGGAEFVLTFEKG